ncbi:unnamed protein product, partial [Lota lota]
DGGRPAASGERGRLVGAGHGPDVGGVRGARQGDVQLPVVGAEADSEGRRPVPHPAAVLGGPGHRGRGRQDAAGV